MQIQKKIVTIVPQKEGEKSSCNGEKLWYKGINFASELDGDVLLKGQIYSKIFKKAKKNADYSKRRLSIVKITNGKRSVHRAFRGNDSSDFKSDYIGLTQNSINMLSDENGNRPTEVILSPGCWIPFYWNHPDKAIMISTRLGFISLSLGVLSVILSIVSVL